MNQASLSYLSGFDHGRTGFFIPTQYIKLFGHRTALLLSQIVYWYRPSANGESKLRVERDGRLWIARSHQQWADDLYMGVATLRRCLDALKAKGIIEVSTFKFGGDPLCHIALDVDALMKSTEGDQNDQVEPETAPTPRSSRSTGVDQNDRDHIHRLHTETTKEEEILLSANKAGTNLVPPPKPPALKTRQPASVSCAVAVKSWNAFVATLKEKNPNTRLRPVVRTTHKREKGVRARRDAIWPQIDVIYDEIAHSRFLQGFNNRQWTVDFDWLWVGPNDSYVKVAEGKYRDPDPLKEDKPTLRHIPESVYEGQDVDLFAVDLE